MSEIGGFGVLTKTPEALLAVGAIVPLAVAMRSYANFTPVPLERFRAERNILRD